MSQSFTGKIYGIEHGKFNSKGQELTWLNFNLGTRSVKEKIQAKDSTGQDVFEIARDATGNPIVGQDGKVVVVPVMVSGRKFTKVKVYGLTADFIIKNYKQGDAISFYGSIEDEQYWVDELDENGEKVYQIKETPAGLVYVVDTNGERIARRKLIKNTVLYVERVNLP